MATRQHYAAMARPRGFEVPIVGMYRMLSLYPLEHSTRYRSNLADDGVLGQAWLEMARGFLALLNGESGRLDCGYLDAGIRAVARQAGFSEEL